MEDTQSRDEIVVTSASRKQTLTLASQKDKLTEFMKVFSLAHQCTYSQPNPDSTHQQKCYKGPSADEEQLVEFANQMGFKFQGGSDGHLWL